MAGMAEVAKATVTIIPNMQGAQAKIAEDMGVATDSAGKSGGNNLGNKLLGALGKVVTVAAVAKIFKAALDQGAALEQSLQGINTLFKENADIVTGYAQNAWQTVGLSASEYMNQVTSISATLIQSLGGDTAMAADYANTAIMLMAQNVSMLGNDMSMVQNAFMGFAKDNYTMLDNLKLGYGGTAAEMARLINDSGVLGESMTVNAQTVKDIPFNTIIDAIAVIQEKTLGIGLDSVNAATTFSGALASMKAATSNYLAAIATGKGVTEALSGMTTATTNFLFNNFLPAVVNIVCSLPNVIFGSNGIIPLFIAKLPDLISLAGTLLRGFASALLDAIMHTDWIGMFMNIVKGAVTAWAELVKTAGSVMHDVWTNVKEWVGKLVSLFDFKWELPKIKMPHVKISGSFSLVPPSVPKFSIDWYDKGGVFTDPTIIGIAEKRPEFVGALDDLREIVRDEAGGNNTITINVYGAEGQNMNDLAEIIMDKIQTATMRKEAVFG